MITKEITAELFQMGFIESRARFPAFVAGWGTGKTLFGIMKILELCERFPGNLALIGRKNFTDLRDSTIRDFERYTGWAVPMGTKEVLMPNGSVIMFRHADEMSGLQNINLGCFLLEQAEEFDTDEQFQMLRGRLRREGSDNYGIILANTKGHNWIWRLWKAGDVERSPEYQLFEAGTFENADNLKEDFIADLKRIQTESPHHYNRFVLNSWEDLDIEDRVIPYNAIQEAVNKTLIPLRTKRVIGCDPAEFGDDETVIYVLENGKVLDKFTKIMRKKEPMETAGWINKIRLDSKAQLVGIDNDGIGSGIRSRLVEQDVPVIAADSRLKANNSDRFKNLKAEMWWNAREGFVNGAVSIPDDSILIEQLAAASYHLNSKGQIEIEKKDDVKKKLGSSPDRADALVIALWTQGGATYTAQEDEYFEQPESKLAESYMSKSVL